MSRPYTVPVYWEMVGYYEVEADSIEEAIDLIKDEPLPENGTYVEESFGVDKQAMEDEQ